MAKTDFLDDNQGRDYPFLKGTSIVPYPAIVACGFTMGPGSGYIAGQHSVFLTRVQRDFSKFWFHFTSNAPGLAGKEIIFVRDVDAERYVLEYSDSASNEFDSVSDSESLSHSESVSVDLVNVCNYVDDFNGFLITGSLTELADLISNDEFILGSSPVEPALIQDLANTYARSINLANQDRTKYLPPPGCEGSDADQTIRRIFVNSTCLQGKIVFGQGYNSRITQNDSNKSLTFAAVTGGGEGEPCEQIPLYAGEMPPAGSMYLEGGPTCSEVVRSIGGTTGPVASILPEAGASIDYDPGNSTIVVNADLKNLAICGDDLLTADLTYYDCNHEAGQPGAGPDGGRGTTALEISPFELSGIGIISSPGINAGLGLLRLGSFTAGGTAKRHNTGSGVLSLHSLTIAGTGGITGQTAVTASGDLLVSPMVLAGVGTFTSAPPPDDTTGGVDQDNPVVPLPGTLVINVGQGGNYANSGSTDSWAKVRRDGYSNVLVAIAPRGVSGEEGGYGGGNGPTNSFPSWLVSRAAILDGTTVIHYGGDGASYYDTVGPFIHRGGGGGGSAAPTHDGNNAFTYTGGDSFGEVMEGWITSGQGGDGGPGKTASEPGGGGGGSPDDYVQRSGYLSFALVNFKEPMVPDNWITVSSIGETEIPIPETAHEIEIYIWGGGGMGSDLGGSEVPRPWTGGGGGAFCYRKVALSGWV